MLMYRSANLRGRGPSGNRLLSISMGKSLPIPGVAVGQRRPFPPGVARLYCARRANVLSYPACDMSSWINKLERVSFSNKHLLGEPPAALDRQEIERDVGRGRDRSLPSDPGQRIDA